MNFRTPFSIPSQKPIELGSKVVALGSCFADKIGKRLEDAVFPVLVNPTGISYNPHSLGASLSQPNPAEVFLHQGLWRSLQHHSRLAHPRPQTAKATISKAQDALQGGLAEAKTLILTLGTAQVFVLTNSQKIVANCHRLDASLFTRRRLSIEESLQSLKAPICSWLEQAKERRVILTVSPVRYAKEGLIESQRGKSVLHLSCEALCRTDDRIEYFPAYEIVTDELRDYRFYADDMLHPSERAVAYVWERFKETYFEERDRAALRGIEKLQNLRAHRLTPGKPTQSVVRPGLKLLTELRNSHPQLALEPFEGYFLELSP